VFYPLEYLVWKLRVESTKLAGLIGFKGFIGFFVVGKSWFTRGAFFLWSNWCGNSQKNQQNWWVLIGLNGFVGLFVVGK
jgi:H+/Cl- antiporter ClcA